MATTTAASTYTSTHLLDLILRGTTFTPPSNVFVALCSTATDDAGGGTEASGGSYARQAAAFEVAGTTVARQAGTTADLDWTDLPAGTWTHVKITDAATAGNVLFHGELETPVTTTAGDPLTIAAGDLVVRFLPGAMTDALADALLDHVLRSESWSPPASVVLALYDAGVELAGLGYARQTLTFPAATTATVANDNSGSFTNVPAATVDAGAIHADAASGGARLFDVTYSSARSVTEGGRLDFAAGSHTVTID